MSSISNRMAMLLIKYFIRNLVRPEPKDERKQRAMDEVMRIATEAVEQGVRPDYSRVAEFGEPMRPALELFNLLLEAIVLRRAHEEARRVARLAALDKSWTALEILGELVPARINEEEIGDAMERLQRMVACGKPIWRIYLATTASIWWILWHTLLHEAERVAVIVQIAMGRGDDKK